MRPWSAVVPLQDVDISIHHVQKDLPSACTASCCAHLFLPTVVVHAYGVPVGKLIGIYHFYWCIPLLLVYTTFIGIHHFYWYIPLLLVTSFIGYTTLVFQARKNLWATQMSSWKLSDGKNMLFPAEVEYATNNSQRGPDSTSADRGSISIESDGECLLWGTMQDTL